MDRSNKYTSPLEVLYDGYTESAAGNEDAIYEKHGLIREYCHDMDDVRYDGLLIRICDLCSAYEKKAFIEGIRVGVSLLQELGHLL